MSQAHPDKDLVVLTLSKRVIRNTTPFDYGHVFRQCQLIYWCSKGHLQSTVWSRIINGDPRITPTEFAPLALCLASERANKRSFLHYARLMPRATDTCQIIWQHYYPDVHFWVREFYTGRSVHFEIKFIDRSFISQLYFIHGTLNW